jgi:hypothetical protein
MKCRHCSSEITFQLIDLGTAPPSNAYLTEQTFGLPETWFPLNVVVCEKCWLVQVESSSRATDLFNDEYAYFSSFSEVWLQHSKDYVEKMIGMLNLDETSMVAEIASNDGYLLQFVQAQQIPCFGVEPTASTAVAARAKGIETIEDFFGVLLANRLVDEGKSADLIAANNVLAHVPDINDFVSGFTALLKTDGVATFEFPHLMKMIKDRQFDTIYHEHYSYLSFSTVVEIFAVNGLSIFKVEQIPTHGGSLRVFAQRSDTGTRQTEKSVTELIKIESDIGMKSVSFYEGFEKEAESLKSALLDFLISSRSAGKKVAAYGAAAKGNTFLNYAGVKSNLISFVSDRNPAKQGKWMPGSHIPIVGEQQINDERPDFVLILPWNLQEEVSQQLSYIREWGAQFVVVQPNFRIW